MNRETWETRYRNLLEFEKEILARKIVRLETALDNLSFSANVALEDEDYLEKELKGGGK